VIRSALVRGSLVALALAVSGCALTLDSTHLGVPVTMAEAAQAPPAGTPFHVTKHPVYLFLGLIAVSRPNLEDVLAGQVGTGASVASLTQSLERPARDRADAGPHRAPFG